MSFLRHGEIYRPISSCGSKPEQPWPDCPGAHRYDEFPAGYCSAGCAPAVGYQTDGLDNQERNCDRRTLIGS
jgi:hypothetical protein